MLGVDNKFGVPTSQWKKWKNRIDVETGKKIPDQLPRRIFNKLYAEICDTGSECFVHPDSQGKLAGAEFATIAWNAAWLAADAVRNPLAEALSKENIQTVLWDVDESA